MAADLTALDLVAQSLVAMLLSMFKPHFAFILALGLGCGAIDPTTPPDDVAELEYAAELERQRAFSVTDVYLDRALAELCKVDVWFEFDDAVAESGAASFGDLAALSKRRSDVGAEP